MSSYYTILYNLKPMSNDNNNQNAEKKDFDPNFINYSELYKSPNEMRMNSKFLIGDYAEALIKGGDNMVNREPISLPGNRYFIDTKTKCLDKDNKEQTRSILVDNVHSEAMSKTKGDNKGLIYSLLASLNALDTNHFFAEEPTDYLQNVDVPNYPACEEVTVYANENQDAEIKGYMTENDKNTIDKYAFKEGFVNVSDYMGDKSMGPGKWMEQANKTDAAMSQQAVKVTEESNESANKALAQANQSIIQGAADSEAQKKKQMENTNKQISAQTAASKKTFEKAKRKGDEIQLKQDAKKYLKEHENKSVFELVDTLINSTYVCDGSKTRRIPSKCVQSIYGSKKIKSKDSIDAKRSNLCPTNPTFAPISAESYFEDVRKVMDKNKNNTKIIQAPRPKSTICVKKKTTPSMRFSYYQKQYESEDISSEDAKELESMLNAYKLELAAQIVRYKNQDTYGHCAALEEGFSHFESELQFFTLEDWLSLIAYFYMFSLLFIFVYILYRALCRFLRLKC